MKTRIFAVIILSVFLVTALLGCTFELSDDEVDYISVFENKAYYYTYDVSTLTVSDYSISMDTYVNNNESDVFYIDEVAGHESKCYQYVVVTVKTACVLDEVAMYIKWDKATSGVQATGPLSVQFFKVPSGTEILSAEWIKDVFIATINEDATTDLPYKEKNDASMPLKDGQWNDGVLTSLRGYNMAVGDKVLIKFPQNCDFNYEYDSESESDDESSKYSFSEKSDNDVSFKLDKLMFHVA